MVVACEVDDHLATPQTLQLPGGGLAVIPVELPSSSQREAEPDRDRGEASPDHTEPGVSLPDVVEESGANDIEIGSSSQSDETGVISVTLVRIGL